jgi:hypothetical protein
MVEELTGAPFVLWTGDGLTPKKIIPQTPGVVVQHQLISPGCLPTLITLVPFPSVGEYRYS